MKTVKVSEATPIQLNWLVAKCEEPVGGYKAWVQADLDKGVLHGERYSTDWTWGGPIIERECVATYASGACSVAPKNPDYWVAEILDTSEMITQYGPTPLIAAMRCYVASKLGDEVEIPEELI